jgi:flavin-dependent dehydrogenase
VQRLKEDEGIEFPEWTEAEALVATPTGSAFNPRLFKDRFILAGALAGFQDPTMVLGVHGALVSGKIAAMALTDKNKAALEFRRMNRWWRSAFVAKRLLDLTHPLGPYLMGKAVLNLANRIDQRYLWLLYPAVPGWMRLNKETN